MDIIRRFIHRSIHIDFNQFNYCVIITHYEIILIKLLFIIYEHFVDELVFGLF